MTDVSIIMPCKDEERFIGGCLDSIVANVFPKERLEVLVIDGRSSDRTVPQKRKRSFGGN